MHKMSALHYYNTTTTSPKTRTCHSRAARNARHQAIPAEPVSASQSHEWLAEFVFISQIIQGYPTAYNLE